MELTRNLRAACRIQVTSFSFPTHPGFRDLQWMRFGRLFVQTYACSSQKRPRLTRRYWLCNCDCGGYAIVESTALLGGRTTSCGCRQSEVTVARNVEMTTHGEAAAHTVEYTTWASMKARCNNPNFPKYHLYGGRGIKVCDRWVNDFSAFLEDMGRRPPNKTSIDRIDGDKGYEPGNCRWADDFEQNRNRKFNR
jgi:hypothetical protein